MSFVPGALRPALLGADRGIGPAGELLVVEPAAAGDPPSLVIKPTIVLQVFCNIRLPARWIPSEDGSGHVARHAVLPRIVRGRQTAKFGHRRRHRLNGISVPVARDHEIIRFGRTRVAHRALAAWI